MPAKTPNINAALDAVNNQLVALGNALDWRGFGTVGLVALMSGRGVTKSFKDEVRVSADTCAASNHARLKVEHILETALPQALKDLRKAHAECSGGLDPKTWSDATMSFVLANGGSASVEYSRTELHPTFVKRQNIPLPRTGWISLADRLKAHGKLDLKGPSRAFEFAESGNTGSPYQVHGPDPVRALQRLWVLLGIKDDVNSYEFRRWTYAREVLDMQSIALAAQTYH